MRKNGIKILLAIFWFIFLFIGRLNAYTITLDSNRGSEVFSPEVDSWWMILGVPKDPKWANHMFLWWFDENWKRFKFVGTVLSWDITLTARWSEFSNIWYYWVVDGEIILIEMMDRNLGATTNDTSNTWSYGYYYQWWNNYGFLPRWESTSSVPLSWAWFWPWNWFVWENFIKSGNDWSNSRNDNLRGWWLDNSSNLYNNLNDRAQRQWPCPDGYHIPSLWERNTLFDLFLMNNNISWVNNFPSAVGQKVKAAFAVNSDALSAFLNQLKIPFAWRVKWGYEYDRYEWDSSGKYAYFWSSTPLGKDSLLAEVNNNSGVINVWWWPNTRAQGIPIRCFKNQSEVWNQAYMFDANWGYFSGWLTWKTEYYINGISLNPNILIIPEREWYGFDWWYTQADSWDKIELHQVSGSKQLYAHWVVSSGVVPVEDETSGDVVQDLDIYFIVDDNTFSHYTIQDRNPWATSNDISSTGSYGYQYQWWNNHGFLSCGTDGCWGFPWWEGITWTLEIHAQDYWPGNYYSWNIFIKSSGSDWADPQNDNLWWDDTDASGDNPSARQWPCDTWYHVPSSAEWLLIQNAWLWVNSWNPNRCTWTNKTETNACAAKIQKDLLLPNVGRRNHSDWKVWMLNAASYWTSSPSWYSGDGFYYNSKESTPSNSLKFSPESRARARSVRCVKDVYNTPITIDIAWWTRAAVSVYWWKLHYLTDPAKTWYSFGGWYSNLTWNIKIEDGGKIDSGITVLYAKWIASDEYEYIFHASGWIFLSTNTDQFVQIYKDGSGVDLSNIELPIRTGFNFVWWYDKNMENEYTWSLIVSWNLDLYAKWVKWTYTITWKNEDGTILETDENVEYWSEPSYDWAIPVKTWNAQYNYTFAWWSPTTWNVEWDATYTAVFTTWINSYTITWKNEDETVLETDENVEYWSEPSYDWAIPTKTWDAQYSYTFAWWSPTTWSVAWDAIYTAVFTTWTNSYTVTWKNEDGTILETDENVAYWSEPSYDGATPTKTWDAQYSYTFAWWSPTTWSVTWDATYTAVFTQTEIGGSASNKLRKDSCPNWDFSSSYYDGTCGSSKDQDHGGWDEKFDDQWVTYSDELQQAYERAYENWITTMSSINDVNVYEELSRIEMAKMLSKYAINVLGKTVEWIWNMLFDDVDSELDNEYDNWVSISSEMEVMWVNMPNNKFRPFDLVPRSEFVTAFSRMKYGTTDWKDVYYSTHMDKLKNEGIITKTDPNMMELVWYVMIMFMRSTK